METLGSLIESYEDENVPDREGNPIEALKALMEEHDLKQSDLPEVGSQGVVSEVFAGRRQLNIRQIKALSERFGVSPAVFI
jgi:HTH-type transcriptional regulator / antitoxin HigA